MLTHNKNGIKRDKGSVSSCGHRYISEGCVDASTLNSTLLNKAYCAWVTDIFCLYLNYWHINQRDGYVGYL